MTETVHIQVGGMSCAACQAHVQRALSQTNGVRKAAVNLMSGHATAVFDPAGVAPVALMDAIRDTGYEAELPSAAQNEFEQQEEREKAQAREGRDLCVKAIASLIIGAGAIWVSMSGARAASAAKFTNSAVMNWLLLAAAPFVMAWAGRGIFVGAFKAARYGSADMNALIALGTGVDTVVFDKTGAITQGKPRVIAAQISDETLRLAAAAERRSEHPLGDAVVQYAESRAIALAEAQEFCAWIARGVEAKVEGHGVLAGDREFRAGHGVVQERRATQNGNGILVAIDRQFAGSIQVSDPIRRRRAPSWRS